MPSPATLKIWIAPAKCVEPEVVRTNPKVRPTPPRTTVFRSGCRRNEARPEAAVPTFDQRALAHFALVEAGEAKRPGVRWPRVGRKGIKIAPLVITLEWRQRRVVAQAEVERQLRRDLPVVLDVGGVAAPVLPYETVIFGLGAVDLAEEE